MPTPQDYESEAWRSVIGLNCSALRLDGRTGQTRLCSLPRHHEGGHLYTVPVGEPEPPDEVIPPFSGNQEPAAGR